MISKFNVVVCIGGASGTGKSMLARRIAEQFSVPMVAFSDVLLSDAAYLGLDVNTRNLQDLGVRRIEAGWSAFVTEVTGRLGWPPPCAAVIEGIRHPEAIDSCRDAAGDLPVLFVYIDVTSTVRDRRLAERNGDNVSRIEIDAHTVESEVLGLRDRADVVLRDGSVEDWLSQIEVALTTV